MDGLNQEYFTSMIRRARPLDLDALVGLVMRATLKFDMGDLLISRECITSTAQRLISDPQSLVLVHETQGVDGAIVLAVNDGLFFERKAAGILFWYAAIPRSGYLLLRHAMKWCKARPAIKAIGLSLDFGGDERVGKLLQRAGLKSRGRSHVRY